MSLVEDARDDECPSRGMWFKVEILQECLNAFLTWDLHSEEALKLKKAEEGN